MIKELRDYDAWMEEYRKAVTELETVESRFHEIFYDGDRLVEERRYSPASRESERRYFLPIASSKTKATSAFRPIARKPTPYPRKGKFSVRNDESDINDISLSLSDIQLNSDNEILPPPEVFSNPLLNQDDAKIDSKIGCLYTQV